MGDLFMGLILMSVALAACWISFWIGLVIGRDQGSMKTNRAWREMLNNERAAFVPLMSDAALQPAEEVLES